MTLTPDDNILIGELPRKGNIMEIAIFAKKKQTKTGKAFVTYLTTLTKKDGTTEKMRVKFRQDAGEPENCPVNIVVEKSDINIDKKMLTREDTGEIFESKTLWVSKWSYGTPYVDTSLDEYDI